MISDQERQQLKALIQDPKFRVVESIAQDLCDKINSEPVVAETEWETLKKAIGNDEEVRGIKRLIQTLYDEAGRSK